MSECWPDGALRAFLDRELPQEELGLLAAHLEKCSPCSERLRELSARAVRILELMEGLESPAAVEPRLSFPEAAREAARALRPVGGCRGGPGGAVDGPGAVHAQAGRGAGRNPPNPRAGSGRGGSAAGARCSRTFPAACGSRARPGDCASGAACLAATRASGVSCRCAARNPGRLCGAG